MSLRLRLSLLFLGLLILGMLSVLERSIGTASREIRNGIQSSRLLSQQVIDLLAHTHDGALSDNNADFIAHLQSLEKILIHRLGFQDSHSC